MELNFDKEIDAILRKAREGEAVAAANAETHLDADTLSAFAENALPEKAKMRSTEHLADCARCRKILSNLILLGAETESEIVHAADKSVISALALPWYRKLFLFPNLAYSLGALVLVFGGLIAFTVFQGVNNFQNSELSQTSEKPMDTKSAQVPATANSATNTSNSTANTTAPANFDSVYSSNSAAPHSSSNSNMTALADKPIVRADEMPSDLKTGDSDVSLAKTEATPPREPSNEMLEESKRAEAVKDKTARDSEDDQQQTAPQKTVPSAALGASSSKKERQQSKSDSANTGETTSVGGKIFRREGAAWVDTAYERTSNMRLPSLTYVSRGSSEYKKLDGDLRGIAERLSGVVIVVWKSKVYRIQ